MANVISILGFLILYDVIRINLDLSSPKWSGEDCRNSIGCTLDSPPAYCRGHTICSLLYVSVNLKPTSRGFSRHSLLFLCASSLSAWLHTKSLHRDSRIAEKNSVRRRSNFLFSLLTAGEAQFAKPDRTCFHLRSFGMLSS